MNIHAATAAWNHPIVKFIKETFHYWTDEVMSLETPFAS